MLRRTPSSHSLLYLAEVLLCLCWLCTAVSGSIPLNCKFPNEGCGSNSECCSDKCIEAHPGTNARCTKLSLHQPCLYTYQCEDRLRCGKNNTCCSKYWGICSHAKDCCDPAHKCIEADGFFYKRCLCSSNLNQNGSINRSSFLLIIVISIATVLIKTVR